MQRFTWFLVVTALCFQFSSCTLGYFASKNQKVSIQKDSLATLLIADKAALTDSGKYLIPRKELAVQLKLSKEGYKDEYRTLLPNNFTMLGVGTVLFNTAVAVTFASSGIDKDNPSWDDDANLPIYLFSGFLGTIAGYGYCFDTRLWNYNKNINLNLPLQPVHKKDATMKELYLNKVAFDVSKANLKFQKISSPSKYYKNRLPNKWNDLDKKGLVLDNSVFADEINDLLKKNGFIDTSGLALKGSFKENIFLNTTVTGLKVLEVFNTIKTAGFSKLTLNTKWEVLDIYKNVIYADTLELQSGEFSLENADDESFYKKMINDALESGLYRLMSTEKFSKAIKIPIESASKTLNEIEIKLPSITVSNLEEAVQASVTVKTSTGHGSGFLISDDGYLITNYHVVSDTSHLEVLLNDGTKYKVAVVQINKDLDLALLKIDKKGLVPFLLLDNESIAMGKEIFAIGTPKAQDLSQTLSKGIISAIRNQSNGSRIIQTDASINGGNSGGPLVDKDAKLLGVVNAKIMGIGVEGISFAIPITQVPAALKIVMK